MSRLTATQIAQYGDELYESLFSRVPVAPLTARDPGITVAEAYQIQEYGIKKRLALGDKIVGKKPAASCSAPWG
jgi:2-oxopent-4-enoate/cis-2-oxohex-4-enoate hydratase